MATEIERKFLVKDDSWRDQVRESVRYAQGYLTGVGTGPGPCSVRVRIGGGEARLNIKSATVGTTRLEYEYPVPLADAREMLETLCVGPPVEKVRHVVEHAGREWEIDVFSGENEGLVVAEVELGSADDALELPAWVGPEVTDERRYYNAALVEHPYRLWEGR